MTPNLLRRKLEKIKRRFEEIEETLQDLPVEIQNEILEYHNQDATLQYCTRWGLSGIDELIEASEEIYNKSFE